MRPILRVRDFLAWSVGAVCPGGPPEECGHLSLFNSVGERAGGDRVFVPPVSIDIGVILRRLVECVRTFRIEHNRVRSGVVRIASSQFRQSLLKSRAGFGWQNGVARESLLPSPNSRG